MAHRINERNIGNSTLKGMAKKRSKKLTADETALIINILERVYDAMEEGAYPDYSEKMYFDGGRFVLALYEEQMFDLFQAIRKLNQ